MMSKVLLDTDTLSYFLKGNELVLHSATAYLAKHDCFTISIITSYEIMSGLEAKGAKQQLKLFKKFLKDNEVLNLTEDTIAISSSIYGELRRKGKPLDDIDILIAGIAIEHKLILATNNEKHFHRIEKLKTVNWAK